MAWRNSVLLRWDFLQPPYIVLLGDVGTGKSTILEKLTGEKGRSSDATQRFTRTSEVFWVPDGSLIVADTPGSNALKDKLDHNVEIAAALNFRPVSRIFIVVQAKTRIDSVVDNARKYADRFLELPMDVVGVLVTHMDMVNWTEKDFRPLIEDELGIDAVAFSWINTDRETLKKSILKTCTEKYNLTVNDENFFKLFKIHNNHRKILKSTSDEVKKFSDKKRAFDEERKAFSGKDLVDLVFEFQAYMTDEVVEAQKRMSKTNNFTFEGDCAANEAGHVANMVNQVRVVLYDIRTECLRYQSEHGVSEFRKCPHCGIIWTKVEGCEGDTTCGNRPNNVNDFRDPAYAELGTFSFRWLVDGRLRITKVSHYTVKSDRSAKPQFGCGKSINWKEMATVAVPSKFSDGALIDMAWLTSVLTNFQKPPYIVLLGDVGTGKSTILEKLTGEKGRSSDATQRFTRTSEVFWVPDGSLIVADTPGSNALKHKLDHNVEIAAALNFRPVSRIFIVVQAETRIDSVVDNARKYADRFLELPMDVVGVLVTHMDMVDWTEKDFRPLIEDELGIDAVAFSWINTDRETLKKSILKTCTEKYNLTVNDENFFKLFKIHNNDRKILKSTSDEVKKFSDKKRAFDEERKAFSGKDLVDLVFEFQAYMTDEIVEAQKRMSKTNNFTFEGDCAANEAGHVANMVNQVRVVLYDIRTECLEYQSEHGVSEFRKCPHCGTIWTKVEGCEGDTTCGNRPNNVNDFRDPAYAELGTFSFRWLDGQLSITKVSHKTVESDRSSRPQFGCGKSINWKEMAIVAVPSEFRETVKVGTTDVKVLPPTAAKFQKELSGKIDAAGKNLKLGDRPSQS